MGKLRGNQETEKNVKWIKVLLDQSRKVRMQLWQNFHQAQVILGEDFENVKGEGHEVHKSTSEKNIRYKETQSKSENLKLSKEKVPHPQAP